MAAKSLVRISVRVFIATPPQFVFKGSESDAPHDTMRLIWISSFNLG